MLGQVGSLLMLVVAEVHLKFLELALKYVFHFCQPLFPGESGVDQLVEIIKVTILYFSTSCKI